jgi:hypothetical protein
MIFLLAEGSESFDRVVDKVVSLLTGKKIRARITDIKSYPKNADYVQRQEAHLNQYNQMCYPAYAGARADEKAEHTREYVSLNNP